MHLAYSVGSLLYYNDFSTINVYVTLFWLLGNAFVIVCSTVHSLSMDCDVNDRTDVINKLLFKVL